MNWLELLELWIRTGKIVSFVLGKLEPEDHAMILEAAKRERAVADAINQTKLELMHQGITQAKQQSPETFIASGMLEAYIHDRLRDEERQSVELMVAAHPSVGVAFDSIKRAYVEHVVTQVQKNDAQALIDSGRLYDYVLGDCTEEERLEIELAATIYPTVGDELNSLRAVTEILADRSNVCLPTAAKERFADFLDRVETRSDGWTIVMPSITATSRAVDFQSWLSRIGAADLEPSENLTAIPLDVNRDMTTLFVVIKELLEEEVHINVIERFLVLQGSCIVRMPKGDVVLNEGDYYCIPKFTPHTVIVTSQIACKLIVQQVAA
jgi:mannose-6-phosphate isomerase-like protein (cupin superfamily)